MNYRDHIGETHKDGTPHNADPRTVQVAYVTDDSEAYLGVSAVFDIWCSVCGQSGSFSVLLDTKDSEINWI